MSTRTLGRSGLRVSAMGMGCWAIGGPLWSLDPDYPGSLGWGEVYDQESVRAIRRALDLGVDFFDTADAYGCGHSERVLGQALAGRRDQVVVATKFGSIFDQATRTWFGHPEEEELTPAFVRRACEASLRRLHSDYIDLYQFHWAHCRPERAAELLPVLEDLVAEGKIRCYGWSTTDPQRARVFAEGKHCAAIQYHYNLLERNQAMLALCEAHGLASIARGPLAMGLLTGKFNRTSRMPEQDVRHRWDLQEGREASQLEMLEAVRSVLTRDGRTLAQAALGWLLARSEQIIPIPGFKTVAQVEENAVVLELGPLSADQMREIDETLGSVQEAQELDYIVAAAQAERGQTT